MPDPRPDYQEKIAAGTLSLVRDLSRVPGTSGQAVVIDAPGACDGLAMAIAILLEPGPGCHSRADMERCARDFGDMLLARLLEVRDIHIATGRSVFSAEHGRVN